MDAARRRIADLDELIRTAGYDEELRLKLAVLISLAEQREEIRAAIGSREAQQAAVEGTLPRLVEEAERCLHELQTIQAGVERKTADAEASQAHHEAVRARHGSADLIVQAAKDLDETSAAREAAKRHQAHAEELRATDRRLEAELSSLLPELEALENSAKAAEETLDHLMHAHAAAGLRERLTKGEPCPVCEQIVNKIPKTAGGDAAAQARRQRDETRAAAQACQRTIHQKQEHHAGRGRHSRRSRCGFEDSRRPVRDRGRCDVKITCGPGPAG
jgi:exonuclease SbcC